MKDDSTQLHNSIAAVTEAWAEEFEEASENTEATEENAVPEDALEEDEIDFDTLEAQAEKSPVNTTVVTHSSTALMPVADTGSFESYLRAIRAAPKLTTEEEWELGRRLREENDLDAAQKLVFCNLRYVVYIAQSYSGYGLNLPDLVQEGNVGLMRAVKRFDPDKKVKLMTFATHWIRAEIHEFIIKNWRIVKMATTKAQRKLFFKLRSSKASWGWMDDVEAKAIAKKLDVDVKSVYQMEGRMTLSDSSFDPLDDDDENSISPSQYLPDIRYSPEQLVMQQDQLGYQTGRMFAGIDKLDPRSRDIIQARWLGEEKLTLKDLSERYQVSLERIRQIEAKALLKLRGFIEEK